MVVAPPIVRCENDTHVESEELTRLFAELARVDTAFKESLRGGDDQRVSLTDDMEKSTASLQEAAAKILRLVVFKKALDQIDRRESWMRHFTELCLFKEASGHTMVPTSFKTSEGFLLGKWVAAQRVAKLQGRLGLDEKDMLDKLGFAWDPRARSWAHLTEELLTYKNLHGNLLVPSNYTSSSGFRLGQWVQGLRIQKKMGRLQRDKVAFLDKLGMVWDVPDKKWVLAFEELKTYVCDHGDALVPHSHVTANRFRLGCWVSKQRQGKRLGRLQRDKVASLDKLGFVWDVLGLQWDLAVEQLQKYKAKNGDVLVTRGFETTDGYKLGRWVSARRWDKRQGRLPREKVACLDKLGMVWDVRR